MAVPITPDVTVVMSFFTIASAAAGGFTPNFSR
jgi:hypothetical protein